MSEQKHFRFLRCVMTYLILDQVVNYKYSFKFIRVGGERVENHVGTKTNVILLNQQNGGRE